MEEGTLREIFVGNVKVQTCPVELMYFYVTNDKEQNEKNRAICKAHNEAALEAAREFLRTQDE